MKLDYTAYVTESALRTPWGGQTVWKEQFAHLLRAQDIGVAMRVIPDRQTDLILLHSRSETNNCVEVRGDLTAIRDSKSPELIVPVDARAVSELVARIRAEH